MYCPTQRLDSSAYCRKCPCCMAPPGFKGELLKFATQFPEACSTNAVTDMMDELVLFRVRLEGFQLLSKFLHGEM